MPKDVQPAPLLPAVADALTMLCAKYPPPFVEISVLPTSDGYFPTPYQVERAVREEAKRRVGAAPQQIWDEYGETFTAAPLPTCSEAQLKYLRAATRCPPNGRWAVYVLTLDHDSESYW